MAHKIFASKNSRKKALIALAIVIALLLTLSYLSAPLYSLFKNPDKIKNFILGFGIFAPLVLILLQVLQVLIAPIPGQITGFASGYIFGTVKGTFYTTVATVLGSLVVFVLARKLGRPFVEKVIDKATLKKFDYISGEKGTFALFLIYLLPALPDDAISFMAGLTQITIKKLVLIAFLGRLPGLLILNMVGSGVAGANAKFSVILFSALMVVSFLIYVNRERLEIISIKAAKSFKGNHAKANNKKEKDKLKN